MDSKNFDAAAYRARPENREKARQRAREWRENNRERDLAKKRAANAAKPKKGRRTGEAHHLWKGGDVGYGALHRWVTTHKGRPAECEHCGTLTAKRYEWANVDHMYRRTLDDWLRLCTSCHRTYDYQNGLVARGGRKKAG